MVIAVVNSFGGEVCRVRLRVSGMHAAQSRSYILYHCCILYYTERWVIASPSLTIFPRVQLTRENYGPPLYIRARVYTHIIYFMLLATLVYRYARQQNGTGSAGQQSKTLYYMCNVMSIWCTYTLHGAADTTRE